MDDSRRSVGRRSFATGMLAATSLGLLAGCSGDADGSDSPATDEADTTTATTTQTTTETDGPVQHSLDEPFTVGTGDNKLEYVVRDIWAADEIGGTSINQEADGKFVVPIIEITNRASEPVTISNDHIVVGDTDNNTYAASSSATTYLSADDRFDADPILFEELNPNVTKRAGLVFDVAPGRTYVLWFNPTGILSGEKWHHYVGVGSL